ncbi:MAG: metallophosphoesterase, partial [Polyangiaceae bacterium]|nr:metallophosphoesterase [Polyangiaceae bacterium]
ARDPDNLNLRFCAAARAVCEQNPDQIVISGDLTDDAEGFELILECLAPFFERNHVSCIAGNHDVYPSPPLWVQKANRKGEAEKRMLWATFAQSIGHPPRGSHLRDLGEGIVLVCLDSCHRARVPGSASGLVQLRDLHRVARDLDARGQRVRLACLHHHVVNPPLAGLGLAPIQAGMRLRNAGEVFQILRELRFSLVMNGHRHIGYRFQPAHAPLFLSSPSTTIGCRSGAPPFFWRIDVRKDGVHSVHEVKIPPL